MEGHIKSTLKNFNPHLPQEMTLEWINMICEEGFISIHISRRR